MASTALATALQPQANSHRKQALKRYRGTHRRCSAKKVFRSAPSAGWEIFNCLWPLLGITDFFKHFKPSWLGNTYFSSSISSRAEGAEG